ncbi:MAG: gamma-glutamyl-gamma-aminobutyrate hydrolase family protein [Calothrix sp. C42_A2020_038]|nr:gamma-glutamyl-gamma-aminobutyrate hydrolase family protein [Calothrix sp. C42_A2020_038]
MSKPSTLYQSALIGITTYGRRDPIPFSLPSTYLDSVRKAGGTPLLLPPGDSNPATLLKRLDGLIITGGGDINPALYNGTDHPMVYSVDNERDAFEINLAKFALENEIPVLGICRGLQILVVASGGTLIPHIPDEYGTSVAHRLEPEPGIRKATEHNVVITPNSRLGKLIQKTQIPVVSWHHQAIGKLPSNWRAVAHASDDKVIEAAEHLHHPWAVGVQWHPEMSQNDPNHERIFKGFIESTYSQQNLLSA